MLGHGRQRAGTLVPIRNPGLPPTPMTEEPRHRNVRSFVKRAGRTTRAQQRALSELMSVYGVDDCTRPLTGPGIFKRDAALVMEIGFGNGETLAELALNHPEKDYLGIEVHEPGIGHLLLQLQRHEIKNVRVIRGDAVEILRRDVADGSLDEVLILFPDPWPKKRHHKRRLVQPAFLDLLAAKIKTGGSLQMATDWEPYAEHMMQTVADSRWFDNVRRDQGFIPRPDRRPTKFERRGQRLGHRVWDLQCQRNGIDAPRTADER